MFVAGFIGREGGRSAVSSEWSQLSTESMLERPISAARDEASGTEKVHTGFCSGFLGGSPCLLDDGLE